MYTNIRIFDTICSATEERQREAAELAQKSDFMIVIGGRHSSNTKKLWEICRNFCPAILVESAAEINGELLRGCSNIGITAGASTPVRIIKEVQEMSENLTNEANATEEVSFAEMLEQNFKSTYTGEKVTGVVTGITPTEIIVEIGAQADWLYSAPRAHRRSERQGGGSGEGGRRAHLESSPCKRRRGYYYALQEKGGRRGQL